MKQLFFAVLALVVFLLSFVLSASKIRELKTEIEAQEQNVDIIKNGEREYRMRDSTKAVEIQALLRIRPQPPDRGSCAHEVFEHELHELHETNLMNSAETILNIYE